MQLFDLIHIVFVHETTGERGPNFCIYYHYHIPGLSDSDAGNSDPNPSESASIIPFAGNSSMHVDPTHVYLRRLRPGT